MPRLLLREVSHIVSVITPDVGTHMYIAFCGIGIGLVWFGFLFQTNFLATLQNCYAAREMYPRTTEPAWDVTPTDRATIVDYGCRA